MTEIIQAGAPEIVQPTMVEHTFINRIRRPVAIALTALGSFGVAGCSGDNLPDSANPSTTTEAGAGETIPKKAPTTTADEKAVCDGTWVVKQANNDGNRWFADGVEEIAEADTDPEARDAFAAWLHEVKKDPDLLAGAAAILIDKEVNAEDLTDGQCASDLADQIAAEIEIAVAMGEVKPSEAPASGRNTGTNANGEVVTASQNGISGDRKAILIVTIDGKKVFVMKRCGNPVTEDAPNLPEGPTDQPPITPDTTTSLPPPPPETIKIPEPLPSPHPQPGDGGEQGDDDEPECDSAVAGYCEGQTPTATPPTDETNPPNDDQDPSDDQDPPITGVRPPTTEAPINAPTAVNTTAPDGPPPDENQIP